MLYPLKFIPIYKKRIWGGNTLKLKYNKSDAPDSCGESWEITGFAGNVSVVANGFLKGNDLEEIIETYMGDLVGDKVYETFGCDFPFLVKLIDANDDLSVQVHPDNEYAYKHHESYGKSEMWYILNTAPGAKLVSGFKTALDKNRFLDRLNSNSLNEILNIEIPETGDVFYIPAGRIHTLGKGIVIAEIQQSSDITYRVWDFDRIDETGKKRELHLNHALEVLDYNAVAKAKAQYNKKPDTVNSLIETPQFNSNLICLLNIMERDYGRIDSFIVLICTQGSLDIVHQGKHYPMIKGETILIPAEINEIRMEPDGYAEILEAYIG